MQVDKNRQNRNFYKALEPAESQSYRHFLQLRWRQNHRAADTFLTLLLVNTQHLLQHYCRVGCQFLNWSSPGKIPSTTDAFLQYA